MMRSLMWKILLWSVATLMLALAGYFYVSFGLARRGARDGPFQRMHAFHLAEAVDALERGGPAAAGAYLERLHRYLREETYMTDANGRDVVNGADRSSLLREAGPQGEVHRVGGNMVVVNHSTDDRYRLIVILPPPLPLSAFVPYYLLILAAVALLCWLLAVNIATPLRKLAHLVDRFGSGDLTVRAHSTRRDEIGELGKAFDTMADRIQTLLTAERRLLQDVSHELRSPLARLTFAAELIKTAPDRDAAIARLRKEIDRLTELVSALIQMTRAEGDPASHRAEPLALSALVREVAESCQLEAQAHDCRIAVLTEPDLEVRGDRELLRRAVENVVRNAVRYAPPHTDIELQAKRSNGKHVVSVRDHGPGVPADLLEKIFSPFFRVDESRHSGTGGIGLGLAIAKRAVQLHQGEIHAVNAQPGLAVSIELPASANESEEM